MGSSKILQVPVVLSVAATLSSNILVPPFSSFPQSEPRLRRSYCFDSAVYWSRLVLIASAAAEVTVKQQQDALIYSSQLVSALISLSTGCFFGMVASSIGVLIGCAYYLLLLLQIFQCVVTILRSPHRIISLQLEYTGSAQLLATTCVSFLQLGSSFPLAI